MDSGKPWPGRKVFSGIYQGGGTDEASDAKGSRADSEEGPGLPDDFGRAGGRYHGRGHGKADRV